jgi:hypothetical protein
LHTNLTPDQEKCCAPIGHKERGRKQVTKRKIIRIDHLSKLGCHNMVSPLAWRAILMHSLFRHFTPLLLAASLASPIAMIGCQSQPDTSPETVIYTQWEHDTNRQHQDLNKRPPAEQKEYSDWRALTTSKRAASARHSLIRTRYALSSPVRLHPLHVEPALGGRGAFTD